MDAERLPSRQYSSTLSVGAHTYSPVAFQKQKHPVDQEMILQSQPSHSPEASPEGREAIPSADRIANFVISGSSGPSGCTNNNSILEDFSNDQ